VLSAPVFCRRFIGRQRELRFLIERRRELAKAHGGVVLIGGEAGLGKSRLVAEFLAATKSARGTVATAQCTQFDERPYGPILELLDTFAPGSAAGAADSQDAQLRGLVDGFVRAADRNALVAVLEDYHWADRGTATVLGLVAEAIERRRVLFVVTYRSDELHANHPLYLAFGGLMRHRNVWPIALAPLNAHDSAALIEGALAEEGSGLDKQARRNVARAGEGNPFFTEELLKNAVDRARAQQSDSNLPDTVRSAIVQRLDPLDDRDRAILTQAAVIGRQFDGDVLARTLDAPFESLLPSLQRARRAQLLEETGEPHVFRFRHALTREAIYDDLLVAQRRPLHERIAQTLEEMGAARSLQSIAYHWWAAGNAKKALEYGERAGDAAMAVFEYGGAADAYERVLPLLEQRGADAARVNSKIGTCLYRLGVMDRAAEHYAPAWAYLRTARGDADSVFRLVRNLAGALTNDGRYAQALALWAEAMPVIVQCADERITTRARLTYAAYLLDEGEVEAGEAMLRDIDPRAMATDPEVPVGYWGAKSAVAAHAGDRELLDECIEQLCAPEYGRSLLGPVNDALETAANAALFVGDAAGARRCLTKALDACVRLHSSNMLLADTLIANAWERVLSGEFGEGAALYRRALEPIAETKVSWYRAWSVAWLVRASTGDDSLAVDEPSATAIDDALATGKPSIYGPLVASAAALWLRTGNLHAARDAAGRAVAAALKAKTAVGAFPLAIVAAQACGAGEAASIRELTERHRTRGIAPEGEAALAEAILARRFGDGGAAHARRAVDLFRRAARSFYEATALDEAGDAAAATAVRRRLGCGDDAGERPEPVSAHARLSGREIEIARLVASGSTNREIAVALDVSVKLVEKHLSAIYRKLDIGSRTQLTAWMLTPRADEEKA
jgi:DNA-binding CsgD family transcriptional regulator